MRLEDVKIFMLSRSESAVQDGKEFLLARFIARLLGNLLSWVFLDIRIKSLCCAIEVCGVCKQ